ncbi:RNA exonuclease 5 [Chelonus insularis]|uniref:RNA exonuclease 5 n=1 Tax=Chelonus insularis TaxID=460826 RepID=UPI00158BC67A|nr:RNA exonuclease 5 [Chelonus insularis]
MLTEKQRQRMEKKRKKMAALLEISKLNDKDRQRKMLEYLKTAECSEDEDINKMSTVQNSNRKRSCDEFMIDTPINTENIQNSSDDSELQNKKPKLVGEEYLKLKQQLRERKKILKNIPRLSLKLVGENASLNINVNPTERIPIFLTDIQHLLLYSLFGHNSPHSPARWCTLEKFNRVSHTVVFIVEGLSVFHFHSHESLFSGITSLLDHRLEIVTPAAHGGSIIEDLATIPLTGTQRKNLIEKFGSLKAAIQSTGDLVKLLKVVFPMQPHISKQDNTIDSSVLKELPTTDKFPRTQLLLSPWQLVEENYPLPLRGGLATKYKDYILTKDIYLEATPKSPMFGLDCEMCRTTSGSLELTRISIVDETMNVIYETLVKPTNKITDYLTQFSGITEKMLHDVDTTLSDVQTAIRSLLPADAILVGQSLNADLHSLKMMHPYVIDTSVIFNITGDRYRKTKLQVLAREFLNQRIQENNKGHCSTEDSQASMQLVQLKLANSVDFGDAVLIGQRRLNETLSKQNSNNINGVEAHNYGIPIFKHVAKEKKTAAIVGTEDVLNEYSQYLKSSSLSIMDDANFNDRDQVRLVMTETNKQAIDRASQVAIEHALTFCHIKIPNDSLQTNLEKTCQKIDRWTQKIWHHMAVNGLLCVVFGGEKNAANGACFLNLKKEHTPLHL